MASATRLLDLELRRATLRDEINVRRRKVAALDSQITDILADYVLPRTAVRTPKRAARGSRGRR